VTSKRLFAIDFSSWILTLFVVMKKSKRNNLSSNSFLSSCMANEMVQISSLCITPFVSCIRFSKHLSFIFPMLAVQINLSVSTDL